MSEQPAPKIYATALVNPGELGKTSIAPKCIIGDFAFVMPRILQMEEGAQIGPGAIVSGGGTFFMKKYSVLGFGAIVITATDTPQGKYMCEAAPMKERDIIRGSVTLEENSYVGSGATIIVSREFPDIVIGKNSVVGAMTFINRSVPEDTIIYQSIKYIIKTRY